MRIYLSSTNEDFKEYRDVAVQALLRLEYEVDVIHNPKTEREVDEALDGVSSAGTYVGIIGHRYGFVPEGPNNPLRYSIAELEYRRARSLGIPCFVFLVRDDASWPAESIDTGESAEKLAAFKQELIGNNQVFFFDSPDQLALGITQSLEKAQLRLLNDRVSSFDVFLSHNSKDREAVAAIAERLQLDGVRVWWDKGALQAGDEWRSATAAALARAPVVAFFVGPSGIGHLQNDELFAALSRLSDKAPFHVFPVILPNSSIHLVPVWLQNYQGIFFGTSVDDPEAYERLKEAILRLARIGSEPRADREPRTSTRSKRARANVTLNDADLQMLPELLYRLVARLRERPEMLQSLEVTAFWSAVRKVQSGAFTLEDLRSLNAQLANEQAPGALWAAWVRNNRATELAALVNPPEVPTLA